MAVLSLSSLPLGFRFRPTDEELVRYYLRLKINGNNDDVIVIREIDVCKWEPWDLPDLSVIKTRDPEWFFFCPLDRKYPNGSRLNRATEAGYWKATGKDRRIKSGVNLIGMKKTLVFYTGRAPKGKRTNWVMHEYRATEDDLDGTKPGQTAFVLLKLFKKQDENLEVSHCDETEPTSSSPAVKSSLEDVQSELELPQVSPSPERQEEKHSGNAESCFADFSDRTTSCTQVLGESHSINSNVCDVEDQAAEVTGLEEDPQLEADLNLFYDPILEPLDYKIFSPLHSQMQAELGSSCMLYPNNAALSNNNGMQFQYGSNETDGYISEFLDSVIKDSEGYSYNAYARPNNSTIESEPTFNMDSVKDSGSCSGSDVEVAQEQVLSVHQLESECPSTWQQAAITSSNFLMETTHKEHLANPSVVQDEYTRHYNPLSGLAAIQYSNSFSNYQELGYPKNANGNGDISGTAIKIRSRPVNQPYTENPVNQGSAPRRLRLQTSAITSSNLMETTHKEHLANPSLLQDEYTRHYNPLSGLAAFQYSNSFSNYQELGYPKNANGSGDISGTAIRIRSCRPVNQPYTENPVNQGSAPRRLRLQTSVRGWSTKAEHNHAKRTDKEEKTVSEGQRASIPEEAWENIDRHQELHAKSRELVFAYKKVSSITLKAPSSGRTTTWCYATMFRVAVVAVVFLMSVCTWRFLKVGS